MSILVVCPNGHGVKAKDKYAGKVCLCPVCSVRMEVTHPLRDEFAEDSIMDVLKPQESGLSGPVIEEPVFAEDSIMDVLRPEESGLSGLSLDVADLDKEDFTGWMQRNADNVETFCAKCQESIPGDVSVCPHCHAYVVSLQD